MIAAWWASNNKHIRYSRSEILSKRKYHDIIRLRVPTEVPTQKEALHQSWTCPKANRHRYIGICSFKG